MDVGTRQPTTHLANTSTTRATFDLHGTALADGEELWNVASEIISWGRAIP
jgi:hypothetical protein